ncbi:MAG TPA: DUF4136 domain-containing protein [Chitinophagaceae bacterium]
MKKLMIGSFLLGVSVMLLTSCQPTMHVSTDYDKAANFSSYKTFAMYSLITSNNVNELNEERLWNSIRREMAKKGYTETNTDPDLLVNAVTIIDNKQKLSGSAISNITTSYGTLEKDNYKEGSLVIDIIDVKANKLVWQGSVEGEYTQKPKDPEAVIKKAVSKLMNGFPKISETK